MKKEKNLVRNSNFELMRIISMFLIVMYHTIYHGKIIQNSATPFLKIFFLILEMITIIHVNSFVLVSGYYQSESQFKLKKVINLMLLNLFYSLLFIFLFSYFHIFKISEFTIIKGLSFLNINEYWFIKIYIFLFCLSPYLNIIIKNMNKKEYKTLLILLIIFLSVIPTFSGQEILSNNGYTLSQFVMLYLIGGYLKKYPINIKSKVKTRIATFLIFFGCVTLNFLLILFSFKNNGQNEFINYICNNINVSYLSYSNPIILLQSLVYFLFFLTLDFQSKLINKISSLVLGVYFIHDNNYVRLWIYKFLKIDNGLIYSRRYILYFIVIVLVIFVLCLIIEYIRKKITKLLIFLKKND